MNKDELDTTLAKFYAEARKKDGSRYSRSALLRNSKLSVASCQLRVVSWFLSVAILQATNILFIASLIVMYYDTNA